MSPAPRRTVLLATDRGNSIIGEVVDGKTNAITYSAYGEQSAQQDVATRLGFNGQLRERNIGWYLLGNGYRAYNPRLMRFHSPDSWSPFSGGGLNAYMYCMGDPVNRSDPTGHISTISFLILKATKKMDQLQVTWPGTPPNARKSLLKPVARFLENFEDDGLTRGKRSSGGDGFLGAMSGAAAHIVHNNKLPKMKIVEGAPGPWNGPSRPWGGVGYGESAYMASNFRSSNPSRTAQSFYGPSRTPQMRREHNQLQGGEVHPRQNHWPSSESFSSTGSSWTNASNTTQGSSIHSDRYSHASSLRSLEASMQRLNEMERDRGWSSSESFHSAVSSIRNT